MSSADRIQSEVGLKRKTEKFASMSGEGKVSHVGSVAAIYLPVPEVQDGQLDPVVLSDNIRLLKQAVMSVDKKLYVLNVHAPEPPMSVRLWFASLLFYYFCPCMCVIDRMAFAEFQI
jgi:hypothetical protein